MLCTGVVLWKQSLMTVESWGWMEKVTQFTKRNSRREIRDMWPCYCNVLSCLGKHIPQDKKRRKKMESTALVDEGSWTCWWVPEHWEEFSTSLYFTLFSSGFRLRPGHRLHGGRGLTGSQRLSDWALAWLLPQDWTRFGWRESVVSTQVSITVNLW